MLERAVQTASELLGVQLDKIEPAWVYRALDEYAVQTGKSGDRDMFVYREGFYRASSVTLFFLSLTLLIRMIVPGASIQFTRWLFPVSWLELLTTAVVASLVAWLFLQRYKRFADYRVTRAVLSALVIRKASSHPRLGDKSTPPRSDYALGKLRRDASLDIQCWSWKRCICSHRTEPRIRY